MNTIINAPTAEESLAMKLRDIAHRVDFARWNGDANGPAQHELFLAWKALGDLADALDGGSCEPVSVPVAMGGRA